MKRLLRNDGKWGARFTKLAIYLLLLDFGFVYIYPVIYMVLVSLMPTSDLINPTIHWVPTHLDFENFAFFQFVHQHRNHILLLLELLSLLLK